MFECGQWVICRSELFVYMRGAAVHFYATSMCGTLLCYEYENCSSITHLHLLVAMLGRYVPFSLRS